MKKKRIAERLRQLSKNAAEVEAWSIENALDELADEIEGVPAPESEPVGNVDVTLVVRDYRGSRIVHRLERITSVVHAERWACLAPAGEQKCDSAQITNIGAHPIVFCFDGDQRELVRVEPGSMFARSAPPGGARFVMTRVHTRRTP